MRAVVTVSGEDRRGIIAAVSAFLSERDINILDISQTILGGRFAMVMLVDVGACPKPLSEVAAEAEEMGNRIGMSVRLQHEDLFNVMHTV